jgi:hypothetical protein
MSSVAAVPGEIAVGTIAMGQGGYLAAHTDAKQDETEQVRI